MRVEQPQGTRGSLKWIQMLVNRRASLFDRLVRERCSLRSDEEIEWVSPLESDQFAEYRDAQFLRRLGIDLKHRPLRDFWPRHGPQWDALGRTDHDVFLVEAKANLPELVSPPCGATSPSSIARIRDTLSETRQRLMVDCRIDWTGRLYQYTNRIAHLYLLRELNRIPAHLIFVYFVGDADVNGPKTIDEWKAALTIAKGVLGLPARHRLSNYITDIFVHVDELDLD